MESDFEGLVRNTHMSNPIGGHVVELWECSSSSFLHKLAHTLLLLCQSLKWACPTATMYQPSPGISSLMRQCQETGSWTTCVNWMGCIYYLMVPVVTRTLLKWISKYMEITIDFRLQLWWSLTCPSCQQTVSWARRCILCIEVCSCKLAGLIYGRWPPAFL